MSENSVPLEEDNMHISSPSGNTNTGSNNAAARTSDSPETVASPLYTEENTGRWSRIEHAAFLKGIELYGKEWKKVAILVQTRTVMQTRTHAQKYYEKLAKVACTSGGERFVPTTSIKMNSPAKLAAKLSAAKDSLKQTEASSSSSTALKSHRHAVITTTSEPVQMTDFDILVPISEATALRAANKEYMDLMKVNCFIFHSLPLIEQAWFARNMVNFVTMVRHRRWVSHLFDQTHAAPPQYRLLADPTGMVQNDFRMDPLKVAGFTLHPFWLLGEHDIGHTHNNMPFVHRTIDGSWKTVTTHQVREILKGEGLKNLLLLPPTVQLEAANAAVKATTHTPKDSTKGTAGAGTIASDAHLLLKPVVDAPGETNNEVVQPVTRDPIDDGDNESHTDGVVVSATATNGTSASNTGSTGTTTERGSSSGAIVHADDFDRQDEDGEIVFMCV